MFWVIGGLVAAKPTQEDFFMLAYRHTFWGSIPKSWFIPEESYLFNINEPLNDLMIKVLRLTGQLSECPCYDLDYDNQVIATEKWDAVRTYKKCYGYQPCMASIEGMPVNIEGRNGNSQRTFEQATTLDRMFDRLKDNQIRIGAFRADSGSYLNEAVKVVEANAERFYIRARRSAEVGRQIGQLSLQAWNPIRLDWQPIDVAEIPWTPFDGMSSYRLILSRIKRTIKGDLFSG